MSIVLWVVGEPGVGKTTMVREMVGERLPLRLISKPKWSVTPDTAPAPRMALAGHYSGGTFDGADTVPYNGVKDALAFWHGYLSERVALTVLDGDRFSSLSAMNFFNGQDLRCVHLASDQAAARRAQRGSNQNEAWIRGRVTKARNFAQGFKVALWLDGAAPARDLASQVMQWLGFGDPGGELRKAGPPPPPASGAPPGSTHGG